MSSVCWCGLEDCSSTEGLISHLQAARREGDALRAQLLDVHDALHRECDGKADLPAEIRALRAQVERVREALPGVVGSFSEEEVNLAVAIHKALEGKGK